MKFTAHEVELITCALAMMAESDEENGHMRLARTARGLIARFALVIPEEDNEEEEEDES